MNHPNIVQFFGVYVNALGYHLVMEYVEERLHLLRTSDVLPQIFFGVSKGLDYLHKKNFVHRDVKTSNILVKNGSNGVLCDFGLVRLIGGPSETRGVGTAGYKDPELRGTIPYEPRHDIYGFGMCVKVMKDRCMHQEDSMILTHLYEVCTQKKHRWDTEKIINYLQSTLPLPGNIPPPTGNILPLPGNIPPPTLRVCHAILGPRSTRPGKQCNRPLPCQYHS